MHPNVTRTHASTLAPARSTGGRRAAIVLTTLAMVLAACSPEVTTDAEADADPFSGEAPDAESNGEEAPESGEEAAEEANGEPADDAGLPDGMEFGLEQVAVITWIEHEDAFNYEVTVDGVVLGTAVGGTMYSPDVEGDASEVHVEAFTFDGDELGEVEFESIEVVERYVLRFDIDAYDEPFIGIAGSTETSSFTSSSGLTESPNVITTDPGELDIVLFGEAAERDDDVIVPTPWEFDDGEVIEHGPFIELPLS